MSIGLEENSQPEYQEPEPDQNDVPDISATDFVLRDIARERVKQDVKWGEQNHPLLDPMLIERGPQRMAEEYGIPTATRARFLCQNAAAQGQVTWAHILVEEVAEFVGTLPGDIPAMREELVQIAAVAAAAIDYIDRNYPF